MPVLVGVAIVAASEALGVGGAIAGAIGSVAGAAIGVDAAVVVGDIAAGAIVGAAAGAATSAVAGTDPGQGALWGAASGGLTAGGTDVLESAGVGDTLSKAISSGVSTTGVDLARGASPTTALEQGLTSAAGSVAGNELVGALNKASTPSDTIPPNPAGPPNPDGTIPPNPAGPPSPDILIPPNPAGPPNPKSIYAPSEQVNVSAPRQNQQGQPGITSGGALPVEQQTVTATKDNAAPQSNVLDLLQQDRGVQSAEKGLVSAGLFNFLFPQGGSGGAPAGTGAGGVGGIGGSGAANSPAVMAALLGQSGQAGGTSAYAPGGPIFGAPEGASKYSPWNVESLRTTGSS